MANPAREARDKIQTIWPGATVHARHRKSIIHKHPTNPNRFTEACFLGPVHIEGTETEIDTDWIDADPVIDAPWLKKMVLADYHAFFGPGTNEFDAGQIIKYRHPGSAAEVTFQAQQLQWTNDLDQISPVADPQKVTPSYLLDQIVFVGAFGPGLNFTWETQTARLSKWFEIEQLAAIGSPPAFILSGPNPSLRLQFIFQKSANVEIWIDGQLWDEKSNNPKQTINNVEFRSAGQTLWFFQQPVAWDGGGELQLVQRFRKVAQNLFVEIRVPWTWLQSADYPVEIDPSISPLVTDTTDDGRWGTTFSNTSANHTFGNDSNEANNFQRFTVTGPANGDTIESGTPGTDGTYLRYVARLGDTTTTVNTNICAVKGDDPAAPTTPAEAESPSGGRTTAQVAYDNVEAYSTGNTYYTPDISTVIQEIIDQGTWDSGDHITVYVEDDGSSSGAYRRPRSYDASTTDCPRLYIEYTAGGGVTVSPAAINAIASKADPTVVKGSITVTPTARNTIASKAEPTVIQGSLTLEPTAGGSIASSVNPTVILGSITVTPSAREAIAGKLDPTVDTGGVIVAPSPAPALTDRVNPTIAPITETKVSPNPGSAIAGKADPTVVAGDIYITPAAAAGARAVRATPTVHYGSTTATPSPSTTIAGKVDPGIFQSSTTATPTPASAIASKQDPPLDVTPEQSYTIASSTGPTVIIGGIIPTPASAIASAANPNVDLGGVTITPDTPVDCITRFAAPTVWIRNPVIVSMTLPARSFAWSLSDRAGIYVETQLEFEDGSLALFEDGDSLIWGASNAGIRLPVRPFALTIESRD